MFWRKASSLHTAPVARRTRVGPTRHSAPVARRARPKDRFLLENRLGRLHLGRHTRFTVPLTGAYKTYDAALAFARTLAPRLPNLTLRVGQALPALASDVLTRQWQHLTQVVSPSIVLNRLAGMGRQARAVVRHMAPVSQMFNEVGRLRYRIGAVFQHLVHRQPQQLRPQQPQARPVAHRRPRPIALAA